MKQESPISFRIEAELNQRLEECSKRLRVKKYTLALLALEAAVDAVEKNDYRIALPIQFDVTHVVTPKPEQDAKYPDHKPQPAVLPGGINSTEVDEGELIDVLKEDAGKTPSRKKQPRVPRKSPSPPAS